MLIMLTLNLLLPEILVTDNGTEIMNNEIITLSHLYNNKHETSKTSRPMDKWTI